MAAQPNDNTIFLTEQEAERIRTTVKERAQKCSELAGQGREPNDVLGAHQKATGAALLADMGGAPDPDATENKGKGGGTIPAIAVGEPYAPSIATLNDLEPMGFKDLKINTHHRGRKLAFKRKSPVVILAARSWTMVQDEAEKDAERLEICLHKLNHGDEILELGKTFVLKEPYFTLTEQGEPTIRIDHPSDLVTIPATPDAPDAVLAEKLAKSCKDKGNTALKEQDPLEAHSQYTDGLRLAKRDDVVEANSDLARDIARNRAHVNLLLSRFDEAKADAKASLTGKDDERSKGLDSKAYYRAGSAAYNLGQYEEARSFFQEQQKLTPEDKEGNIFLRRIDLRLKEREQKIYDFRKLKAALARTKPRVDVAGSTTGTQPKDSPGRGRGLFATQAFNSGDLILAEKAFCVVYGHEREALTAMTYDVRDDRIRVSPVGLTRAVAQKLLDNPSLIGRPEGVMNLYGDWQGDDKSRKVTETEDGPVVDVFRVYDIVCRNAFGTGSQFGEEGARDASTGLWTWAAYTNHSCIPNATKEFIGDLIIVRAIRPIKAGEEIFFSYDATSDYDARQTALMTTWGFECTCELCRAEKADTREVRVKRKELEDEADAFIAKESWSDAKRLTLRKAQRLAKSIEDTYDEGQYKDLPKRASEGIQAWLARASPRK